MVHKGRRHEEDNLAVQIAYIHGRIEAQLESFAQSLNIPSSQLASRVGALLLGAQGGEIVGPARGVSKLRREAAAGSSSVEPVEMAGGTRGGAQNRSKGPKGYWAKLTPEQRSEEMRRRYKKRTGGK
jgi:hypothetical protein